MTVKGVAAVVAAMVQEVFEPSSPTMLTGSSVDQLAPAAPPDGRSTRAE